MNAILLHHAGGNKFVFKNLENHLIPDLEPIAIEIPGRGDRFSEPLLTDVYEIVDDVYKQVLPYVQQPYCILGLSMGTMVSFLLMEKLRNKGKQLPKHVFMVARESPDNFRGQFNKYTLASDQFWSQISKYGGVPQALLDNKELRDIFEPIVRSDFEALERYVHRPIEPLAVNATILLGDKDIVKDENAQTWQLHFKPKIDLQKWEGGHFFMFDNLPEIAALIKKKAFS